VRTRAAKRTVPHCYSCQWALDRAQPAKATPAAASLPWRPPLTSAPDKGQALFSSSPAAPPAALCASSSTTPRSKRPPASGGVCCAPNLSPDMEDASAKLLLLLARSREGAASSSAPGSGPGSSCAQAKGQKGSSAAPRYELAAKCRCHCCCCCRLLYSCCGCCWEGGTQGRWCCAAPGGHTGGRVAASIAPARGGEWCQ
jgi:hypothetical protein